MVGVAQLVRAPDCGSGSRRFESGHPPCCYPMPLGANRCQEAFAFWVYDAMGPNAAKCRPRQHAGRHAATRPRRRFRSLAGPPVRWRPSASAGISVASRPRQPIVQPTMRESSRVRPWIEIRAATSAGRVNISLGVVETLAVPLPPGIEQASCEATSAALSPRGLVFVFAG